MLRQQTGKIICEVQSSLIPWQNLCTKKENSDTNFPGPKILRYLANQGLKQLRNQGVVLPQRIWWSKGNFCHKNNFRAVKIKFPKFSETSTPNVHTTSAHWNTTF